MLEINMFDLKALKNHEDFLKDKVFFANSKWPHFNILFKNINVINSKLRKNSKVVIIERSNLYGQISLFKPFFYNHDVISIDCTTKELKKRGNYNEGFVKNKNIIKLKTDMINVYSNIKIKNNSVNCVIIPNLLHHIPNPNLLFSEIDRILKKNGMLFIFEPLLRELHQIPEDYYHFTPFSLKEILKKKFKNFKIDFDGGPFTAILYCWDQARQYLPINTRKKFDKDLKNLNINFQHFDKKYNKNLLRKNTKFPVSFTITGFKK